MTTTAPLLLHHSIEKLDNVMSFVDVLTDTLHCRGQECNHVFGCSGAGTAVYVLLKMLAKLITSSNHSAL